MRRDAAKAEKQPYRKITSQNINKVNEKMNWLFVTLQKPTRFPCQNHENNSERLLTAQFQF